MNSLPEYMLKLSVCYAAAYLFYWFGLSRLTSYKMNRFYLLFSAVFAFTLPLLKLDLFISRETISNSVFINRIPTFNIAAASEFIPAESVLNISAILMAAFAAGVVICLAHFIMQLLSFKKITAKADLVSVADNIKLYHLDDDIMPFSFGNAIYVNKHKHTAAELDDIIRHEAVHVHQQHTTDVITAEIVCILNWYNPFVWLMKSAIKQNLEFLADDSVLKDGADKKNYQYLLLKVTGYMPLQITSSFKLTSLKHRIYMMNKTKTSQKHLLKLFLMLPLIAVIMLAFRNTNTPATHAIVKLQEETFMLSELSYNIADAKVNRIVKQSQDKSLLQPGKPFSISVIKNERDRLKTLLEKNGYNNISNNAISFLIDSTLANNRFAVQVNIDLKRKSTTINNLGKQAKNSAYVQRTGDSRSLAASTLKEKQTQETI